MSDNVNAPSEDAVRAILLKEYDHRFNEKVFHMGRLHKQTDTLNIFISILIAVGAVVFSPQTKSYLMDYFVSASPSPMVQQDTGQGAASQRPATRSTAGVAQTAIPEPRSVQGKIRNGTEFVEAIYAGYVILAAVIMFFYIASFMDSSHYLFVNALRLATIERRLNKGVREDVMLYDCEIAPSFYSNPRLVKGLIPTEVLVSGWVVALTVVLLGGLCATAFVSLPLPFAVGYAACLTVILLFHIWQWWLFLRVGIPHIRRECFRLAHLEDRSWINEPLITTSLEPAGGIDLVGAPQPTREEPRSGSPRAG